MRSEVILLSSDAYDRLRKDISADVIAEIRRLLAGYNSDANSADWISPEEARKLLDVGKTKYQELKNDGAFKVSQHGRKVRVYRPSINEFLKKNSFDSL